MRRIWILLALTALTACGEKEHCEFKKDTEMFERIFSDCLERSHAPENTKYADGNEVVDSCRYAAWSAAKEYVCTKDAADEK